MTDALTAFEQGLERGASEHREAFAAAQDEHALRAANARLVGPQGSVTALLRRMKELPGDRRRDLGKRVNQLKGEIQEAFRVRLREIADAERARELSGPHIDVSLPGHGRAPGRLHPMTRVRHELLEIFVAMGFDIAEGPDVERYEINFDKLGFPPDHPATDMQDTFFVQGTERVILRTHTSNVQVREMTRRKPPLAVVSAGTTFRRDDDATHSPMFMQIEGFMVDEGIHFGHLKGALTHFSQKLFGPNTPVRFRPSYFPFVEPGGEVDVGCTLCAGEPKPSCRVCRGSGWIEILGCGMIHPVVFEHVGYDPERVSGFAFGLGIDRVAMLRYGIPHVNLLYGNDPRLLGQV